MHQHAHHSHWHTSALTNTWQACTWLLAGMGVGLRSQSRLQRLWPMLPEMMVFRGCLVYYRARKTDRVITAQFEKTHK